MSLGLGIFLGCAFLGTIYLFIHTRDTWTWKSIWKRAFLIVLGSVLIIATVIGGFLLYEKWQQRPQVVSSLNGITIGDTLSDVTFKYGDLKKLGEATDKVPKDGEEVSYWSDKGDVAVDVRNNIVATVWHVCHSSKGVGYEVVAVLNGIACGDTGESISAKFPDKFRILCSKNNDKDSSLSRHYDVVEYGTRYTLDENKVTGFMVGERRELQSMVGVNWDVCSKQ